MNESRRPSCPTCAILPGLVLAGLLAVGAGAGAQDYSFQGFAAAHAVGELNAAVRDSAAPERADDPSTTGRRAIPKPSARQRDTTGDRYTPSAEVQQRVSARVVESLRKQDPEGARALSALLSQQDPILLFDRAVHPLGLRSDSVLDVLTAYWLTMWAVANDWRGTPTRANVKAVRAQVAGSFDPARAGLLTNARRQEFAESLILRAVLMDSRLNAARRDGRTDVVKQLGDTAQRELLAYGLDLRSLAFTEQGLVARR